MSRRIAGLGSLLLAGLLLGSLGLAAPAAGQQGQLGVGLRGTEPAPGKLRLTIAMSGPAWTGGTTLEPDDLGATMDGRKIEGRLKPTGIRPKFVEKFEVMGIHLPPGLFGYAF